MTPKERAAIQHALEAIGNTVNQALDTIREALAEPQTTTPDVCGEVCARAKLCYGCGKALDEANSKIGAEDTWLSRDELAAYWRGYANGKREALEQPVSQEPTVSDAVCGGCAKKASDGWALYCVKCWEKAQPVSQEPVATDMERADAYLKGYTDARRDSKDKSK